MTSECHNNDAFPDGSGKLMLKLVEVRLGKEKLLNKMILQRSREVGKSQDGKQAGFGFH